MPVDQGFIFIEGLLAEGGQFELLRGYESRTAGHDTRFGGSGPGARSAEAVLLDRSRAVLSRATCDVHFPAGCQGHALFAGTGLVTVAVALNPKARFLELRYEGSTVFAADVGEAVPSVTVIDFKVEGTQAFIELDAERRTAVTVRARVADGRVLTPRHGGQGNTWTVDLGSLEGLGEATILVEATRDLRTVSVACGEVALPAAQPAGMIVEPLPDAVVPFGRRGSLVGVLSDSNGRKLAWDADGLAWRIDGALLPSRSQIAPWTADKAGARLIELVRMVQQDQDDGEVLAAVTVEVAPPTEAQKRHADLVATIPGASG